jgi:hypothetical protein
MRWYIRWVDVLMDLYSTWVAGLVLHLPAMVCAAVCRTEDCSWPEVVSSTHPRDAMNLEVSRYSGILSLLWGCVYYLIWLLVDLLSV